MSHRHRGRKLMTVVGARLAVSRARERNQPKEHGGTRVPTRDRPIVEEGKNRLGGKREKREGGW